MKYITTKAESVLSLNKKLLLCTDDVLISSIEFFFFLTIYSEYQIHLAALGIRLHQVPWEI